MSPKRGYCDTFKAYGIADDTSRERVVVFMFWRHVWRTKGFGGRCFMAVRRWCMAVGGENLIRAGRVITGDSRAACQRFGGPAEDRDEGEERSLAGLLLT